MSRACVFALLLEIGAIRAAFAHDPAIYVVGDASQPTAVEVVGLHPPQIAALSRLPADDDGWVGRFALYVLDDAQSASSQPILGSYTLRGTALRFTPRYALRPGTRYRAVFNASTEAGADARLFTKEFALPAPPPAQPARVVAIYPTTATLPENHLRFYIHFSAPMSAGEAYQHIKLFRDDGKEITRAFLEIGEELWDGTGTRFTLLFDPGRVKQGLLPREEFGPVLEPGRSYRLAIDPAWRDASGKRLAAGFEKAFKAGPMVDTPVDAMAWQIEPPTARTSEPLVLKFPRPLDRALLNRMIAVVDGRGRSIDGEITVSDLERRWEFRPHVAWSDGQHELVIDSALEDYAGNNLARPFEVDVFDQVDKTSAPELVRVPFEVN